jgi:peroxiredoxin
MRKVFLFLIMFVNINILFCQQLKINVLNLPDKKAYLYSLSGEKVSIIDSISAGAPGQFECNLKSKNLHNGFHRIAFSNNRQVIFIYTGDDVNIITDSKNISDSLKVISSETNKLYYSFVKLNKSFKTKTELFQLFLARYPKDDSFYKAAQAKINQVQDEYLDFVNGTSQKDPDSFIAKYIRSAQLPVVNYNLPVDKQLAFLKEHALDNVNFKDVPLINSDVFTNKTIEYLTYYSNPQLPKELLEKEFTKAVDFIISKAKVKPQVYKHVVEYLIDGFKRFGFDKILDYIVQNFVIKDELCLDEKTENSIQRRLEQNKKLPVGQIVPNIILPDAAGKNVNISDIKTEKILVLFYASWCTHCQDLVPKLAALYKSQKNKKFEVLAISLDNKKEDWLKFVKDNNLNWLNVSDMKGWDSKPAVDYYIYATPTMFLISKSKKIIGKPLTIDELKKLL